MRLPRSSKSSVAVRPKWMIGLIQRTTSSTADGSSDGSRCTLRSSSWCSMKASMPPLVPLRVVSLPAMTMIRQNVSTSMNGSGSPSTRASVKTVMRSSAGLRFFSSTSFVKYVKSSLIASIAVSSGVLPSRWYSGSPAPIVRLVQSKSRSQSERGTPSIHAITAIGSGAATFCTKSHSPDSSRLEEPVDDLLADPLDVVVHAPERGRAKAVGDELPVDPVLRRVDLDQRRREARSAARAGSRSRAAGRSGTSPGASRSS